MSVPIRVPSCGTVQSLKFSDETANSRAAFIEWCPGNGLVYRALVERVDSGFWGEIPGCGKAGAYMFTYWRSPKVSLSYLFGQGRIAHVSYVREKFGLDGDELLAVTALVNMTVPSQIDGLEYGQEVWGEIRLCH